MITEAKATVMHSILQGIAQKWHMKQEKDFAAILLQSIHDELFHPTIRGAVEEYLKELNK